jgi:hypothetical protein
MKNLSFFAVIIAGILLCSGCIKTPPDVNTPLTQMTATIGPYTFNTLTVYPATLTNMYHDSTVTLFITGENLNTREKIVLSIQKYVANKDTVYSVAAGTATAKYIHATGTSVAIGGQITVSRFTADCINGGFSFTTADGYSVTSGTFAVPIPDYVMHPL